VTRAPERAELLSTGAELLSGRTVNRHAHTLGGALRELGIELVRDTTLPDDAEVIATALRETLARTPLVFVTGGLGPTRDDVTRDAVAAVAGRRLLEDPGACAHLQAWFARHGRPLTPAALRQALVVEGAIVLPNRAGIAPGQQLDWAGGTIFLLPGPPRELQAVWEDHVRPELHRRRVGALPLHESITMFAALGESDLQTWVDAQGAPPGVDIGYCASPGVLEFRLTARDPAAAVAVDALAAAARAAFPRQCFAFRRAGLDEAVAARLAASGRTLSLAESCTGGMIGAQLTERPGASAWFLGGVICYADASKVRDLAVRPQTLAEHGAVSEACAREMASGTRDRFQSTYGLAVTGIAGPDGGSPDKPVGTVCLAVAGPDGVTALTHRLNGNRETVRESARQRALWLLWQSLG
jgi:nicotinamide-nucleotide amidase